jgi:hypothetical protein
MEKAIITATTTTEDGIVFKAGYVKKEFMSTVAYLASYSKDEKLLWERELINKFGSLFTSVIVYDGYIYTAGMRIDRHDKDWREGVLCKWSMDGDLVWERKVAIQQYHQSLTIIPPKCSALNEHEFGYTLNPYIYIIAGLTNDFDSITTRLNPINGEMHVCNYIGGEYYEWDQDFNQDLHPIRKHYHATVAMFL